MATEEIKQHHDIVEHHLTDYTRELVARIKDGWEVSPTCKGEVVGMYGNTFTVSLYRTATTVAALKSSVDNVASLPKPDRAAILAKARDAKKQKSQTSKGK